MADAPACRFYFNDFDMDTADLSCEEAGAYMRLLSYQWQHELVPESCRKRARICRTSDRKMKTIWDEIGRFFSPADGGFLNPRMEAERLKQAEYRRKMQEAGAKGGHAKASSQASSQATPEATAESYLSFPLSRSKADRDKESISELDKALGIEDAA